MDSSTLVLTENVINPDGSRARTKVTLLNGLVSLLVRINSGRSRNFRGSCFERHRLGPRHPAKVALCIDGSGTICSEWT
jgi:hypothetical protein